MNNDDGKSFFLGKGSENQHKRYLNILKNIERKLDKYVKKKEDIMYTMIVFF